MPTKTKPKGKAKAADSKQPKRGRRELFDRDLALRICAMLMTRREDGCLHTIRTICDGNPGMPSEQTFYNWLTQNPDLFETYMRVREERAHLVVDEVVDIADTEPDPSKARIRIDARKWYAGKVCQRMYADKTTVDLNVKRDPATMTDDELERIAAAGSDRSLETTKGSTLTH